MPNSKTIAKVALASALSLAPFTLAAQTLKAVPIQETGVQVALGDITDSRTTGKFFEYLRIEVKLSGEPLETAFGVTKPVIIEAVDDTGRSLVKDDAPNPLFWDLQLNETKKNSLDNNADLLNPARRATSISLIGYVDVLQPQADPASVVTIQNFIGMAGQSLLPKNVGKSGMEVTVLTKPLADKMKQEKAAADAKKAEAVSPSVDQALQQAFGKAFEALFSGFLRMGDNDLLFEIKDPDHQIAFLQVVDASGTAIKSGSRSFSQDKESGVYSYSVGYGAPVPADAQLKIYLATPTSRVHVPFKFENVALP